MTVEHYSEVLLYTDNKITSLQKLESYVNSLPAHMIKKAGQFKYIEDVQRYVLGKILLSKAMKFFDLEFSLDLIKYTRYNRPYFEFRFDFNISHSEDLIVCIASIENRVGVDIEAIKNIEIDYYNNIFDTCVWNSIVQSDNSLECFYHYWTIHEAVLKVQGSGLPKVDKISYYNSQITYYEEVPWFTKEVFLRPDYKCHIASNARDIDLLSKFIPL